VLAPGFAPITFQSDRERRQALVHIPGLGEIRTEPIKNQRAGKRLKSIQVLAFQVCEQERSFFLARALRMILRRWRALT